MEKNYPEYAASLKRRGTLSIKKEPIDRGALAGASAEAIGPSAVYCGETPEADEQYQTLKVDL